LPARDVDPSGSRIALESIRSAVETLGGEVKQQSDAARVARWAGGPSETILLSVLGSAATVQLIRTVGQVIVQWLENRNGRCITVRLRGMRIELKGDTANRKAVETVVRWLQALPSSAHRDTAVTKRQTK
jgi:hypothetical protein